MMKLDAGEGYRRITDLLESVEAQGPRAVAAMDGERSLTYAQLRQARDRCAKALLALGVRRGDRVAMATPPCLDFWVVLHAVSSIGAIWVGINPRYQSRDFEMLLSDATPAVLIAVSPFDERDYVAELAPLLPAAVPVIAIGGATAPAMSLDDFLAKAEGVSDERLRAAQAAVDPEDPAVIVYTSGTTGRPKGAMLSHRTIALSAQVNAAWMRPEDLAGALCAAPVNHVGAINNICMPVMAGGGRIIFFPRIDVAAMAEISAREKPSYMVSSPTGFAMMLAGGGTMKRLSTVRLIVFGGAMTALSVLEQVAPFGARLSSVYGQTETCGIITRTRDTDPLEVHAHTIGTVLPGAELRIAGADGQPAAPGEAGEIQVRGPYVMSGYFNNPVATAEAFTADGFLRTGDIGRVREDGNLVFVGRLKEMFKSGGYNIYPVEIEQAICEHPAVALAAVVAVDDPKFQEVGFAFVQPEIGASVTPEDLKAFLRGRIANYKAPKFFEVHPQLPTLPNGKLDKVTLKHKAANA
jgi:acyl-CoA synthetase (AMP-forming)/AMP-acid ligase II